MLLEIILFIAGLVSCYFGWETGNYLFGILGIVFYMFGLYTIYFNWRLKHAKIHRLQNRNRTLKSQIPKKSKRKISLKIKKPKLKRININRKRK